MKVLLSISIVIMLLLGSGLAYTYNKLNDLSSMMEALKVKNASLAKRNKQLKTKQKKIRSKYKNRRVRLTKQKLIKANKKLISAAPKMIPFMSIPVVVAATSYDIKSYCDEIREMEQFEYDLFGETAPANDDDKICGIDVEAQLQQTAVTVTNQYDNILMNVQKEYQEDKAFLSETINTAKSEIVNKGYAIQSIFYESMENTTIYLSKEGKNTSKFWNDLYDDFFKAK